MSKITTLIEPNTSGFLTEDQRNQLSNYPEAIEDNELIKYFLLSDADLNVIPVRSHSYSRFGFALLLCSLRWLGFIPEGLSLVPESAKSFIAKQLKLEDYLLIDLNQYGSRAQTKSDHVLVIEKHLGFHKFNDTDISSLTSWLLAQAMEHDRPIILLRFIIDKLKQDKITRPPLALLERLIGAAREQARQKTYQLLSDVLSNECKTSLDNLLEIDKTQGKTLLTWLRQRSVSNSPESICQTLAKICYLEEFGVNKWNLSNLNFNRLKLLSRLGKTSTNQALQRSVAEKRYPILVAFVFHALEELIDEVIELFDQSLSQTYTRSRNSLKKHQEQVQEDINEKVRLLKTIGSIILDETISDSLLRHELYEKVTLDKLRLAIDDCGKLMRPENDKGLDYFVSRFAYLRQYTPEFLNRLRFQSSQNDDPVLKAVEILKTMNTSGTRKVPSDAPTDFINNSWSYYVFKEDKLERSYYELCTLWELRHRLRSGDIWINGGRRYNNPEHYLIPKSQWAAMKNEVCELLQIQQNPDDRMLQRKLEIDELLRQLNTQIVHDPKIKIVDKQLVITPLEAGEEPASLKKLRELITDRLPRVGLTDIIMEVDHWVNLAECFHHAGNQTPNKDEFPIYLFAAILSEATNIGAEAMAVAADLDCERIIWYKNWYLREETIEAARNKLVNFQHEQVLAKHFGDGTFSSSDGRRIPVAVKTRTAKALVKYFGYETGLNFYSWTSDQFSQYGGKVTSPTMREATLVLDAILDNETELNIERHTTDTAGYTEIIFALFDLLGLQFDPRIRNIGDQWLYYIGDKPDYANIIEVLSDPIRTKLIADNWDEILRVVASLKKGWVTASLFISKLQAMPQKSNLAKALQEYGKISKTISILRYALSEKHRMEITTQLNKGEAIHDLQQFLHLGREGKVYARQPSEQETHFGCLNLLINMVIVWNTVYMAEAIYDIQSEGIEVNDNDLKHLSPARRAHINRYGKHIFNKNEDFKDKLRPLRKKKK